MQAPAPKRSSEVQDHDLRQQLKSHLAITDTAANEALQERVMAQWRQRPRRPATFASAGPVAALQAAWRHHPALWTGALAALVLGVWLLRPTPDPVMDDLMQPDVLTLISAGEL